MMIEKHLEEMNDLADIMFAMDQNFQDRENEAKSEYQSMRDEIKNKVSIYMHIILKIKTSNGVAFGYNTSCYLLPWRGATGQGVGLSNLLSQTPKNTCLAVNFASLV